MLPKSVTASRSFTYDVQSIVQNIVDMDIDRNHDDVTLEEVLDIILDYVYDDFGTFTDFEPVLKDENGKELN